LAQARWVCVGLAGYRVPAPAGRRLGAPVRRLPRHGGAGLGWFFLDGSEAALHTLCTGSGFRLRKIGAGNVLKVSLLARAKSGERSAGAY
jgi:hypothetical protein